MAEGPPPYNPAYLPQQEMDPLYEYSPGPKGYMPVPQHLPPPVQSPPYGYSPAPPVLSQQSSSNVVVVNQPLAPPSTVHVVQTRANEHMTFTLVMMLLSFLHGNLPAFVCLIPALIFSCVASSHNDSGDYESARKFGNAALCCNGLVFIYYLLLILAGVVVVTVYFTVGFSAVVATAVADTTFTLPTFPTVSIPTLPTLPPITIPSAICYTDVWGERHCTFG